MKTTLKQHSLPSEGFVRLPVVLSIMGISESTWRRGIKAGRYPKSIKISTNAVGWRVEEIRNLIENPEVIENEE